MRTQKKMAPTRVSICAALLLGAGLLPASALAQEPASASPATATKRVDATLDTRDSQIPEPDETAVELSAQEALDDAEKKDDKKWSLSASVGTRIYQGMFVSLSNDSDELSNPHASEPSDAFARWSNVYSVGAGYRLDDFNLGIGLSASQWLTSGGGSLEPYEFRLHDVSLSAGWKGYNIEAIDTNISLSYGMSLPTSVYSRASNLILGNSLSLGVSRTFFEKLTLSYGLSGGWTPHTTSSPTVDRKIAQIFREDDIVGNEVQVVGGVSTEFSLSNSLSASFPIWDKLSGSVSYAYSRYWSHYRDVDEEFNADFDGLQTGGRNTGDGVSGSASLSYPLGSYLSVSAGISTSQQPKTSDNKSFRFPWWNFSGAAANRSSVNFNLSGRY